MFGALKEAYKHLPLNVINSGCKHLRPSYNFARQSVPITLRLGTSYQFIL